MRQPPGRGHRRAAKAVRRGEVVNKPHKEGNRPAVTWRWVFLDAHDAVQIWLKKNHSRKRACLTAAVVSRLVDTQRQRPPWHQLAPQHQVGRVDTTDDVADELWAQRWGLVRAEVPLFIPCLAAKLRNLDKEQQFPLHCGRSVPSTTAFASGAWLA